MTFTGAVGAACMFPLRAIIAVCVALRIHPNMLTLIGVSINFGAAWQFARGRFMAAGFIMLAGNIFDFIDGKVAEATDTKSDFGGFWDSVMDRFSDLSLFVGVIYLYAELDNTFYVMVAALAMIFSVMTSYARARAESMIEKCKVGFMERPERIVLVMIGAFTNRMSGILWVILVLSVVTVVDRIYFTWRALKHQEASPAWLGTSILTLPLRAIWHALYWTFDRATWQYDLMVVAILSFVWLVPPGWVGDPHASGPGFIGIVMSWFSS
ncbi:MAG TPA: CDP-alcohol phosphatidyltransferase family protein [Acidobacteria bacterium]|nr:CDP-alcohol phosphatidyltransferase family protein [Acidobacteriota bacterium]|tara:strand:+ start:80 stop:883 length:804 start_codon:yes stop_codon:yes gene_type:complete